MILIAGLSPAWQQILTFDELSIGGVNRAAAAHWCASGKVLNVGRAVAALEGHAHVLSTRGGITGAALREEFVSEAIPATWIETGQSTRVCTTIIDQSRRPPQITELVENAAPVTPSELATFEEQYALLVTTADLVVLTGSLPKISGAGPPIDLYARLLAQGPPAVLDVRGPELIAALAHQPLLVKPNRQELEVTVGRSLRTTDDLIAAMRELVEAGAQWVLTTDGGGPAYLTNGQAIWRMTPPSSDVVNPIGCGDCLAAGIAVFLDAEEVKATAGSRQTPDVVLATRFGMAASAVNLVDLLPARLTLEAAERKLQDVTSDRIA